MLAFFQLIYSEEIRFENKKCGGEVGKGRRTEQDEREEKRRERWKWI
jgi:hypothetical protein